MIPTSSTRFANFVKSGLNKWCATHASTRATSRRTESKRYHRDFMVRSILLWLIASAACGSAGAATSVLFDPATPATGPFPTDFLTIRDSAQKTGLRLNLPLPPCGTQYTSCQETGLLEQMDGFSVRARGQAKFSAPVSAATLAGGMFYVALNELTNEEQGVHKNGDVIGVDQVIWDPAANTAYAKPASVLDQHRRYAFVVTDAVLDASGAPVTASSAFTACLASSDAYCSALAQAVNGANFGAHKVVAASVFTTMSATAWLEHARDTLAFIPPYVQLLTPQIPISTLAGVTLHEQTGTAPLQFSDLTLPISSGLLAGIDRLVMGLYESPVFLGGDQTITPWPTNQQLPVMPTQPVYFNALLPATPKPAAGYPVVIFGHGFGDSRFGGPTAVAPTLAKAGFAVIAISAVGHGFGPYSTVTFTDTEGNSKTFLSGGRGVDLNGDGQIEAEEGCNIVTPVGLGLRDCFRQTVVDLLQLSRAIRQGIDFDGDGSPDLDGSRIYYGGESLGAMYGTMFTALDPGVRAAALNVGGGTTVDIARISPAYASQANQVMSSHVPSLLNAGNGTTKTTRCRARLRTPQPCPARFRFNRNLRRSSGWRCPAIRCHSRRTCNSRR